ncbi:phosphoesterase RecJ domain-containing protein [Cnuella takakiae]|uniref:Phosphoesterase RecJ domain-containing protein n=1 Tax=Cnuella takakiae TaxID=1302690 RepID=A0A1M4V4I7_9BACT|nr:DHH family phosphoesterase [Cnuella takakiae]OLY92710.1 DHH family phosphoesterase [Cnuella takakiae]SHE63839.1 phosphoesterase RecJ domain-containing protein [Cnuella takakiae]
MQPIHELYPLLTTAPKKVVVTMHQKPDADAMGSTLGLYHFLIQLGHDVQVISPTNWARWVDWMPGVANVLDYELHRSQADELIAAAEWIFCLDFNHFGRTKAMAGALKEAKAVKVLIDHHEQPDEASFNYGISTPGKSSTCEMVYDLIVNAGFRDKINKSVAECLYAGVVADTGSFRFSSTGASVHHMVGYLKEQGLEHARVHEQLFDNYLENRLRFLGHVLTNRMEVLYELNTALVYITRNDLYKYDIKTGDTEGIVNYPLSIQGIKLVGFIVDRDEVRKWSFRSKGNFDCNSFARKYFNGGGHFNAAGGSDHDSLERSVQAFKKALLENKDLLQ